MLIELGAVADYGAFEVFAEQSQPCDQGMNGPQHRPGDIVGVHLIATHHQQRRALSGLVFRSQQMIDTEQAVGGGVMRFAARAMQQLVDPRAQNKIRAACFAIQQLRRPFGDARHRVINQQVVFDQRVAGQGVVERHIDQVNEGMGTDGNDRALPGVEADVANILQAQRQR